MSLAAITAQANVADELVRNSPFLPDGWAPPQPRPQPAPPPRPTQPQPLDRVEFRSKVNLGGKTTFSIFDPTNNRSHWLGLNQTEGGFTILEYKPKEDSIVVRHDGRTRTISLHEAKVQAMAEAAPAPTPGRAQGGVAASQPAASPEERMQNLAEEIRRRREIRRALVEGGEPQEAQQQSVGNVEPPMPPNPEF
jgi:hypothetical protein